MGTGSTAVSLYPVFVDAPLPGFTADKLQCTNTIFVLRGKPSMLKKPVLDGSMVNACVEELMNLLALDFIVRAPSESTAVNKDCLLYTSPSPRD